LIGNNPNIISSAKSLEDVTPINWSKEVLSQFYYFDKLTINYKVIGALTPEVLEELITFINNINGDEINIIIDNLQF
jgi:hypothetical protein